MPRIRRGPGGKRVRAGGGRTRKQDCCCVECDPFPSAQAVVEYLRDNGFEPVVIVEGSDFTDICSTGNCSPIIGTYVLPFDFINPSGGGWVIEWRDTFTMTVCGSSASIVVRVQMFVVASGPTDFAVQVVLTIVSSGTAVVMQWTKSFTIANCEQIFSGIQLFLPAVNTAGGFRRCYTILADDPVELNL